MRPPFAPLGGPDTLVDKMLGNAYDVVKIVAINLAYIKHVQSQIEDVYAVSQNIQSVVVCAANATNINAVATNIAKVTAVADALPSLTLAAERTGTLGALGSSTNIALGAITKTKITGITLTVLGTDGNLYFPDSKLTYSVVGTNIVVVLAADAAAPLGGGTAKAHVTYLP